MHLNFGRATNFEFRYRFWLIAAVYWFAFSLYGVDHRNVVAVFVSHSDLGVSSGLVAAATAHCVARAAVLRSWASALILRQRCRARSELCTAIAFVADGPYRFIDTQSGLYVGSLLFAIGIA